MCDVGTRQRGQNCLLNGARLFPSTGHRGGEAEGLSQHMSGWAPVQRKFFFTGTKHSAGKFIEFSNPRFSFLLFAYTRVTN